METNPKRGGFREGSGRKLTPNMTIQVRIRPDQREKLRQLGGSEWIRKKIDGARPKVENIE